VTTCFRGAVQARDSHSDYSRTFSACASRLQARQSSNAYADGDALSYGYCYSFGDYEHYYFAADRCWDGATDDAVDGAFGALHRVCLG
jgi:hypothetical protein